MITESKFSCMRDSFTIRGTVYADDAADEKKVPVIICHGFTADMKRTAPYGKYLAEKGFRAFTFDFCGGGFETVSDGDFHTDMTPMTEVEDLKCVMDYVKQRDDVYADRLILMGCSQGGFVSSLTAAERNTEVYALILIYPALCIPDDARKGSMQVIRFDPENIPDVIGEGRFRLNGEYARSVVKMDVFREIKGYQGPVLIIHGTGDTVVSYEYAVKASEVYTENGNDCVLHLLEDAPHGFNDEYLDQACELIGEFTEEIL